MSTANVLRRSLHFAAVGLVGDLIAWPVWWYTRGLARVASTLVMVIRAEARRLNLRVWLVNLWSPMYGQSDWQGRAISVVMRLIVLVFRLLVLTIWSLGLLLLLASWVLLPPVILWQISTQLIGIGGWGQVYD